MAEVRNIEINVDSSEADKKVDDLNKGFKKVDKSTEKVSDNINDIDKSTKKLSGSTGGAVKGFKKIGGAVKGVGVAFKALGIGLIISAFVTLKDVFSQNQVVADKISAVFETMSIVFNAVTSAVTSAYESASKATGGFDAMGKVVSGIMTIALTPLKLTFYAIKLAVQGAQLAWEQSVFGNNDKSRIKELKADIEETSNAIKQVGQDALDAGSDIINNAVEAVQEVGQLASAVIDNVKEVSIEASFEQAKANIRIANSAKIASAQQSVLLEKYDRQAEKLRQIRDEERNSIADRIKANDKLAKVLDMQEKAMLRQADLQIQSARNEVAKSNNIENQIALLETIANREGILAQIEGLRSEQLANDLALNREKLELNETLLESQSRLAIEQKKFDAELEIDEEKRLEMLRDIAEEERVIELNRLQEKISSYKEGTQARVDAEIEYATAKQELDNALFLAEEASFQATFDRLDRELDEELDREKEHADDLKQNEKQKQEDKKQASEASISVTQSSLSTISSLVNAFAGASEKQQRKAFEIQKKLSIAQALIDTYKSAQSAYASMIGVPVVGVALAPIAAAGAIAAGLANVKNISKQQFNGGSVGSAPSTVSASLGGGASSNTTEQPQPSFNIVGEGGVNQLQNQQPLQAYVVSGEVTTAQQLDRSRIANATF